MKQTKLKRLLASLLSISMVGSFAGSGVYVSADAGEKPPEVTPDEMVFPDPDSFSYDDVEVNFAKALQYVLYFYDANKCGYDVDENGFWIRDPYCLTNNRQFSFDEFNDIAWDYFACMKGEHVVKRY